MNLFAKITVTVLLAVLTWFGGIFAVVIAILAGGESAATLTVISVATIFLFAIAQTWGLLKAKIRYIVFGAVAGAILLCFAGFAIFGAYEDSIDEINEQGMLLQQYEPFREDTKAVSLTEEPSLTLSGRLPTLDGATALYPLYAAFARATYPESDYPYLLADRYDTRDPSVVCTNTANAYERLVLGEVDIIFAAGPSKEQLQRAKDRGLELTLTPIGREAFVFFVNAKNPVDDLSVGDIQKIYSGEATNWREFGGKNAKIRAFQRTEGSGSQTALVNLMGNVPLMKPPGEDIVGFMGGMVSNVSAYKNYNSAIGYSFLFFATEMVQDNKIKLLSLNGVAPTRENVANRTYPYASEFYAITAGTTNPNAEKLIEWILSGQGQYLVEQTGYTPVGAKKTEDTKMEIAKTATYHRITPDEAQAKMDGDVIILDVREQWEFAEGHIPNALLLPDYDIEAKAADLLPDKDKTILVYCRSGRRSEIAARQLIQMGYTQIYDFGGIIDWTGAIEQYS